MEIKLSAAPAFYVIYLMVLNPNSDSVPLCFILLSVFSPNHPVNVFGKMKVSQKVSKKLAPQMA